MCGGGSLAWGSACSQAWSDDIMTAAAVARPCDTATGEQGGARNKGSNKGRRAMGDVQEEERGGNWAICEGRWVRSGGEADRREARRESRGRREAGKRQAGGRREAARGRREAVERRDARRDDEDSKDGSRGSETERRVQSRANSAGPTRAIHCGWAAHPLGTPGLPPSGLAAMSWRGG